MKNLPDHGVLETIIDNVRRLFDNFVGMFRRQQQNASRNRYQPTLTTITQGNQSEQLSSTQGNQSSLTQSSTQGNRYNQRHDNRMSNRKKTVSAEQLKSNKP